MFMFFWSVVTRRLLIESSNIFTTNMIYANIDDMVKMLDKDSFHQMYEEPNKDLICLEYYKNILEKRIMNILKY